MREAGVSWGSGPGGEVAGSWLKGRKQPWDGMCARQVQAVGVTESVHKARKVRGRERGFVERYHVRLEILFLYRRSQRRPLSSRCPSQVVERKTLRLLLPNTMAIIKNLLRFK